MKDIDFLILYEHKNREFESIVLLKHELVKRGYTVEFLGFNEIRNKKKRKRLFGNVSIAVMPSLYHNEEILNFVYASAGKVKNIVNLRWEQIFPKRTERNLTHYIYPKENAIYAYHCCWGNRPMESLIDVGIKKENLFLTGPIHMDFVRTIFEGYYLSKKELCEKYNIDQNKKIVMFSSSFVSSSWNKWELDWLFSQFDEEEKKNVKNRIDKEIKSRERILEWLNRLSNEKDCTIIYRPHPAEKITEEIKKLKNNGRFKVIGDYNIKQWILTCDQVYTWNSTSIVEASVADIPCAVLRPVEFDIEDEYSIYEGLPYIITFNQLEKYYEDNLINSANQFVESKLLDEYLSIDKSIPSYIRTADVLEAALKDDYSFPWEKFNDEELKEERKRRKRQDRKDVISKIIVKPFYNVSFLKRIIIKLFPGLHHRYSVIIDSLNLVISNEEFEKMEERISEVLS